MSVRLRRAQNSDLPFLEEMLYEAVFWRESANKPSFEEGLAYPEVSTALADWGERDGDTGVVAAINSIPIGAAWVRFWTDDNFVRGYIEESTPVLVIGVRKAYRHQRIGGRMIDWLVDYVSNQSVQKISLAVSKDNYAIKLYKQKGFLEYSDIGDSLLMVRNLHTQNLP